MRMFQLYNLYSSVASNIFLTLPHCHAHPCYFACSCMTYITSAITMPHGRHCLASRTRSARVLDCDPMRWPMSVSTTGHVGYHALRQRNTLCRHIVSLPLIHVDACVCACFCDSVYVLCVWLDDFSRVNSYNLNSLLTLTSTLCTDHTYRTQVTGSAFCARRDGPA